MSLFDEHGRVLISPSRLRTWQECPLKWKSVYVDEMRTPPTPALVFGTAIHKALEAFHRSRWLGTPVTQEDLEGIFECTLQSEANLPGTPVEINGPEMQAQAKRLIEAYTTEFGEEKVAAAELSLSAPLVDPDTGEDLGAQVCGVIDLITEDRRVIDLKSSARTADLFDLVVSHSLQLDAYRWLMLQSAGREPESVEIRLLVRKKQPEVRSFRLPKPAGFGAFLDQCKRYVAFVKEAQPLNPRPNLFCGSSCPAYIPCRGYHGMEVA